ncbi:MAG: ABC transporter substrate-binding protein [Candidatus Hodarchaeota archaeon]
MRQFKAAIAFFFLLNVMTLNTLLSLSDFTAERPPDYFKITLIAPTNNPARVQHASVIARELWKIGIEADLAKIGWEPLIKRLYERLNFESSSENGFDIAFIDLPADSSSPGILRQIFHSSNINPPSKGYNCFPINDSTLNDLLDQILVESNAQKRREHILHALNITMWEKHPAMGIYLATNWFALDADLRGFDPFRWGKPYPRPQELYYESSGQKAFRYVINARFVALNPVFSNNYYDKFISYPIQTWTYEYDANMTLQPVLATAKPIPLDSNKTITSYISLHTISSDSPYFNATANTTWGPNPVVDALQYNPFKNAANKSMFLINLRNNIPWHPGWGYELGDRYVTVEDFQWTLGYWMDAELASPLGQTFEAIYGSEPSLAIQKINETMLKLNLRGPLGNGQVAEWLDACALSPLPQHVLDPTFDATPYGGSIGITPDSTVIAAYENHSTYAYNTGKKPPLGTGPYCFESWIENDQKVTLKKFEHWGGSNVNSLWNDSCNSQNNIETYTISVYPSKESAEIDLENEQIDGIDTQFQIAPELPYLVINPNIQILNSESGRIEVMIYNTVHPQLSNRYVRLAISHLVPAQKIIDFILNGSGSAQEVIGFASSNPYNPTEEEWETIGLPALENVTDPYTGEEFKFRGHIHYNLDKAWALMEEAGYDMEPFQRPTPTTVHEHSDNPFPLLPVAIVFTLLGGFQVWLIREYLGKQRDRKRA